MNWDELFSHVVEYDPAAADKPALPTGGGVYLLTDEQDRLIQLASAADLKRAILNRLAPAGAPSAAAEQSTSELQSAEASNQKASSESAGNEQEAAAGEVGDAKANKIAPSSPVARRRADLSQIVRRIRWQPAHSAFEITYQYWRISRVVLPDTYLKNLAFGPAWCVHADPAAAIPRFTVTRTLPATPGTVLGPFSSQQDANKFVQVLEDAFDLCRYIHILEQAPHGQPCAYHEMGRCPAPCGGLIPMQQYRDTVERAIRFAAGEREAVREEWNGQMRQAASELAFERASALKQRLERSKEIEHAAYRHVRPVESFSWLIVQRGIGRTRVKPFFVRGGKLQEGEPARLKELDEVVPIWIDSLREAGPDRRVMDNASLQDLSEHMWLVSHFLFRRERIGLFLDAAAVVRDFATLVDNVREYFAASPAEDAAEGLASPEPRE